jgi:hypothetical protein
MISIIIPKYYNRLSQHFLVCSASYTSPQVYKQFSLFSPSHLSPLSERLRDRVLVLVGKSYSVIRLDDLCSLLGLSTDQTRHLAQEKGWEVDSGAKRVNPKPISAVESDSLSEHQGKLQNLTDIISFLEN